MTATPNQITPTRDAQVIDRSPAANADHEKGSKAPKLLGMCGFYRQDQFPNGLYSFSENLMRGMAALHGSSESDCPFELTIFHAPQGLRWTSPQLKYSELSNRWGRFAAEARVGFSRSAGLDAVLFPNSFTPPIVRAKRAITVIHDLHYIHLPEHWPLRKRLGMRAFHETTLRKCDAVVSISQAVKEDILAQYGHRWESRIHAIWNPISLDRFERPAEQEFTNGRPYILCAAVDRPYKNLSTLIRAFALLHERLPEYRLVLAGKLRASASANGRGTADVESKLPSAIDLVKELDLSEHVVLTGFIPDEQLGALYRDAALFVLPSLFEGFGMPAVEALALGAPTLVSDLPVLREVTLGSAHYIADPLDHHQMAEEIAHVFSLGDAARPSADFRNDLRQRFAPETIARQYVKLMSGDS